MRQGKDSAEGREGAQAAEEGGAQRKGTSGQSAKGEDKDKMG